MFRNSRESFPSLYIFDAITLIMTALRTAVYREKPVTAAL